MKFKFNLQPIEIEASNEVEALLKLEEQISACEINIGMMEEILTDGDYIDLTSSEDKSSTHSGGKE